MFQVCVLSHFMTVIKGGKRNVKWLVKFSYLLLPVSTGNQLSLGSKDEAWFFCWALGDNSFFLFYSVIIR